PRVEALYRHIFTIAKLAFDRQSSRKKPGRLSVAAVGFSALVLGPQLTDTGKVQEAETLYRDLIRLTRDNGHETLTMRFIEKLASLECEQRNYSEAEQLSREGLELTRVLGNHDPQRAISWESEFLDDLATCLKARDDKPHVEELYRQI